jgi:uncharacterized protein (TIGR03382 family)
VVLATLLFYLWSTVSLVAAPVFEKQPLTFVTSSGSHQIIVEIADTTHKRSVGLMFRRSLGEGEGMIFVHDMSGPVGMWMKNTYIPLDMFFVRADGTIPCLRSIAAFLVRDGVQTPLGELFNWPYVFNTPLDLSPGPMTVRVVATDHADNSYADVIDIVVGGDNPAPDAGVVDPCETCGGGNGFSAGGGGCQTSPSQSAPWLFLFAALVVLRRRRVS